MSFIIKAVNKGVELAKDLADAVTTPKFENPIIAGIKVDLNESTIKQLSFENFQQRVTDANLNIACLPTDELRLEGQKLIKNAKIIYLINLTKETCADKENEINTITNLIESLKSSNAQVVSQAKAQLEEILQTTESSRTIQTLWESIYPKKKSEVDDQVAIEAHTLTKLNKDLSNKKKEAVEALDKLNNAAKIAQEKKLLQNQINALNEAITENDKNIENAKKAFEDLANDPLSVEKQQAANRALETITTFISTSFGLAVSLQKELGESQYKQILVTTQKQKDQLEALEQTKKCINNIKDIINVFSSGTLEALSRITPADLVLIKQFNPELFQTIATDIVLMGQTQKEFLISLQSYPQVLATMGLTDVVAEQIAKLNAEEAMHQVLDLIKDGRFEEIDSTLFEKCGYAKTFNGTVYNQYNKILANQIQIAIVEQLNTNLSAAENIRNIVSTNTLSLIDIENSEKAHDLLEIERRQLLNIAGLLSNARPGTLPVTQWNVETLQEAKNKGLISLSRTTSEANNTIFATAKEKLQAPSRVTPPAAAPKKKRSFFGFLKSLFNFSKPKK